MRARLSRRPPWRPPYAGMVCCLFAQSEARMREIYRCHLHQVVYSKFHFRVPVSPMRASCRDTRRVVVSCPRWGSRRLLRNARIREAFRQGQIENRPRCPPSSIHVACLRRLGISRRLAHPPLGESPGPLRRTWRDCRATCPEALTPSTSHPIRLRRTEPSLVTDIPAGNRLDSRNSVRCTHTARRHHQGGGNPGRRIRCSPLSPSPSMR